MNLSFLSIQHCPRGRLPETYTNEQRARIFRDSLPVELANRHPWDHLNKPEKEKKQ